MKIIISPLAGLSASMVGAVVAAFFYFSDVFAAGEPGAFTAKNLTVEQARSLITSGEDLQLIPKKIWKQILPPEQYEILWRKGTERPYTDELMGHKQAGVYLSAGCRIPVFKSEHKYKSGTGWPSFWQVFDQQNIVLKSDWSFGMRRKEVLSKCGEHLGHVFEDGPSPTGLRYCINSQALIFQPKQPSEPL